MTPNSACKSTKKSLDIIRQINSQQLLSKFDISYIYQPVELISSNQTILIALDFINKLKMQGSRSSTFCSNYKKTAIALLILLSMVFICTILIFETMAKCDQNCRQHSDYGLSCRKDGSLYCCRVSSGAYSEFTCGDYSQCQFDNNQCGNLILGLEAIGLLIGVGTAVMIGSALCPQFFWKSNANKLDFQTDRTRPLITDEVSLSKKQEEPETTGSQRSSTDNIINSTTGYGQMN